MSPNRVVALLTPLVFAPLAGALSALVASEFPGVEVSASALEEIFIAGALIALAPAAQWLHGWQKHEAREAAREDFAHESALRGLGIAADRSTIGDDSLSQDGFSLVDTEGWFEDDDDSLVPFDDVLDVDPTADPEGAER
jgi:hypothetical protein